jgi:hypothetical protein
MNLSECNIDKELFSEILMKENTMNLSECNIDKELFSEMLMKENTMNLSECNIDKELFSEILMKENTLIAYKSEYIEYIIYKNNIETKILINIFDKNVKTCDNIKKGIYNINNNVLTIYWENFICEKYILYNSIYYDIDLYNLNNKDINILDDNNEICIYKINIIENYLYNEIKKIRYIQNNKTFILINNDELKTYYLEIIINSDESENIILLKDKIFINISSIINEVNLIDKLSINKYLNYNIYKEFNKKLSHLTNFELYQYFILNYKKENMIYSIDSFFKKTNIDYNYLNNYIDAINNNDNYIDKIQLGNYEEAIIHWNKYNNINKIFLSNENIEIIYITLNKYYENSLYIINLDNNNYLENIIDIIPKTTNIIININISINKELFYEEQNTEQNNIDVNILMYINTLKEYFNNIILIKSHNVSNYEIMYYIYNKIILNNINISIYFDEKLLKDKYLEFSEYNINKYIENEINKNILSKIIYINKNNFSKS